MQYLLYYCHRLPQENARSITGLSYILSSQYFFISLQADTVGWSIAGRYANCHKVISVNAKRKVRATKSTALANLPAGSNVWRSGTENKQLRC